MADSLFDEIAKAIAREYDYKALHQAFPTEEKFNNWIEKLKRIYKEEPEKLIAPTYKEGEQIILPKWTGAVHTISASEKLTEEDFKYYKKHQKECVKKMTNGEKYKSSAERSLAYTEFCINQSDCKHCKARSDETPPFYDHYCEFNWLDLEAEEKEKEKLLPCPFCGGEATLKNSNGRVWIECSVCHFRTPISDSDSETIEKWNRRVSL